MTDTANVKLSHLHIPAEDIADFCERYHVRMLALFGSVVRDDFTASSDVDVLIEFDPDHIPGFRFFSMQEELATILGRTVDLNTLGFLGPHMREAVRDEAVILYDKS